MKDPSETVQAAHDFVENVDWELLEEAADMGAAVVSYMRQHPWLLIAAGSALASLGAWQMLEGRTGKGMKESVSDLVRR